MDGDGDYVKYNTTTRFKTAPMRDPYKEVTSKALTKRKGNNRQIQTQKKIDGPKNISSLRSKLRQEQERKRDLEKKLQTALSKNTRSSVGGLSSNGRRSPTGSIQSSQHLASRRMYRHPRDMEDDLLYAEDRFMEVQANADKLERVLKNVQAELTSKNEQLKKSEEKVGTLVSMLQDLLSRLAKKELGPKYTSNAISSQNGIWKEPLHMHFLQDDTIDDYIDEKLNKIQLTLDQANDYNNNNNNDNATMTPDRFNYSNNNENEKDQKKTEMVNDNNNNILNGSNDDFDFTSSIDMLNIKLFWSQLVRYYNGKDIMNFHELCTGIYKLCNEDLVGQKIVEHVSSFISDGMKDNYVFGEEEFIAYIRRSNDPIVIRYFNRNT